MKKLQFTLVILLCSVVLVAQNLTYHISVTGNDGNDGLTEATAWQTIARVSSFAFQPGDHILFQAGQTFNGALEFQSNDNGTAINPVYVGSYGSGKATINGNSSTALYAYNVGGIEIHDLIFTGNGATLNENSGVEFYIDQASGDIDYIVIDNIEVAGFGRKGIVVGAWGTAHGFNNVRITNSLAHDNGRGGIETYGNYPQISHTNFYVGYCKAYRNYGRSNFPDNNSGNGILLAGINGAIIEYCEAYENGQNNAHYGGGPVGIWFYDVSNGVIQFSESHHNKAGLDADGAGFDIDGGCTNCIIQYCYSHDNEGTGFGMFEFGSPNGFVNNTIRYNISQNDGRKNSSGGLAFWGVDGSHKITNCQVYNNTVYVNNTGLTNGTPSAIYFLGNQMSGLTIRNNVFYITPGVNMLRATSTFTTAEVLFQNNNYYTAGTSNFLWAGSTYTSLATWKAAASGQEMNGATSLGTTADPLLTSAGTGGLIGPASGGSLTSLTAYHLQSSSPLIDAGLNLSSLFGVNTGTRDYYNNSTPVNSAYDMGAHEFSSATLPLYFTRIAGKLQNDHLAMNWSVSTDERVDNFTLESSSDGRIFNAVGESKRTTALSKEFSLTVPGKFGDALYCRVKALTITGGTYYSKIILLQRESDQNHLQVYPNPATGIVLVQSISPLKANKVVVRNVAGEKVLEQRITEGATKFSINLSGAKTGMYIGTLTSVSGTGETFVLIRK